MARECDRCGALFKPQIGVVSLDVNVGIDGDGTSQGWSDIDFCPSCSKDILDVVSESMRGLENVIIAAKAAAKNRAANNAA